MLDAADEPRRVVPSEPFSDASDDDEDLPPPDMGHVDLCSIQTASFTSTYHDSAMPARLPLPASVPLPPAPEGAALAPSHPPPQQPQGVHPVMPMYWGGPPGPPPPFGAVPPAGTSTEMLEAQAAYLDYVSASYKAMARSMDQGRPTNESRSTGQPASLPQPGENLAAAANVASMPMPAYMNAGPWAPDPSWLPGNSTAAGQAPQAAGAGAPAEAKKKSKRSGGTGAVSSVPDEEKTTIMLRNIPNNYTRQMLLDLLDEQGFKNCYDFVYLPIDFHRTAGLGYAFVNLCTPADADRARTHFDQFSNWKLASQKVCEVSWGQPLQGISAHIERYRNSPVMHEDVPPEYKPILFQNGVQIDFPPPTKRIRPPRVKRTSAKPGTAEEAIADDDDDDDDH